MTWSYVESGLLLATSDGQAQVIVNNLKVISVHTDNSEERKRAREIFEGAGAEDIATTGEASVDAK